MHTQRFPWEASSPYRTNLMDLGYQQLLRDQAGGYQIPQGLRAGGGVPRWSPSSRTTGLADYLADRGQAPSPYAEGGEAYWGGLLSGSDVQNPYRSSAAGLFGDEAGAYGWASPGMGRFADMLFAGEMPGSVGGAAGVGGGGGDGGFGGYVGAFSGSAPEVDFGEGPVGAAAHIRDILGGRFLDGNPHLEDVVAGGRRDIEESAQRSLLSRFGDLAAGGMYGSSYAGDAARQTTDELAQQLGDWESQTRFGDYNARMGDLMQSLGYGTEMDIAAGNAAARLAEADMSARAAGASAGAQYRLGREEIASRERMGRMGALLDALNAGQGGRQFALTGMAGLGGQLGGEQLGAFSLMPNLNMMDVERAGAAFGPSFSIDQLMLEDARRRGAANSAGQNLAWQQFLWSQNQPWANLGRFGDIINAADPGYGTTNEWGVDRRSGQAPYANPWMQAIAGGIGGYQLGSMFGSTFGGSGQSAQPGSAWNPSRGGI
jgi:hypothetical protein